MERKKDEELKEVGPEEVPDFASEKEEAEFWTTHTLSEEFWDEAERNPCEPPLRKRREPRER